MAARKPKPTPADESAPLSRPIRQADETVEQHQERLTAYCAQRDAEIRTKAATDGDA